MIDYTIDVHDHQLSVDWISGLKKLLLSHKQLEKNFCFMGFPKSQRTLDYMCNQLTDAVNTINDSFSDYVIEEIFTPNTCINEDGFPNHEILNKLHNHFERLQGTVWNLSSYYRDSDYNTKYAIRQLNLLCHEIESLTLSQVKAKSNPFWIRPSQITTWLTAERYELTNDHRKGFLDNGYTRLLGGVYMHWTQIGKTLFEVFRDEGNVKLNIGKDPTDISIGSGATCEAINSLRFYSGEFDVEWGNDVIYNGDQQWYTNDIDRFYNWLLSNNIDPTNTQLSLGYLPLGQVELLSSFGTTDSQTIWDILSNYLDIYKIEVDNVSQTYDYCWSDLDFKENQIAQLKPGYDYQLRRNQNEMV